MLFKSHWHTLYITIPRKKKKLQEIKKKTNSKIHVNVQIKTVMLRPEKRFDTVSPLLMKSH